MKGKKLLAGALSAAMLFSTASFTAFAEEIIENAENGIQVLSTTGALDAVTIQNFGSENNMKEGDFQAEVMLLTLADVKQTVNSVSAKLYHDDELLSTTTARESYTGQYRDAISMTIITNGDAGISKSWQTTMHQTDWYGKKPNKILVKINGEEKTFENVEIRDGVEKYDKLEVAKEKIAEVNGKTYSSLQKAYDNATNGATITLKKNIVLSKADIEADDNWYLVHAEGNDISKVTFDLGGHTISLTEDAKDAVGTNPAYYQIFNIYNTDCTIQNGHIDLSNFIHKDKGIDFMGVVGKDNEYLRLNVDITTCCNGATMVQTDGKSEINGGTYTYTDKTYENYPYVGASFHRWLMYLQGKQDCIINGGTFVNFDPLCQTRQAFDTNSGLGEGKVMVKNGGTFTVTDEKNAVATITRDVTCYADGGSPEQSKERTYAYTSIEAAEKDKNAGETINLLNAKGVTVSYEDVTENEGEKVYNIYVEADNSTINRLTSAEFTFALDTTDAIAYEVSGTQKVNVTPDNSVEGRYLFNLNGIEAADITDKKIKIGQITFTGYGTFDFGITDGEVHATTFEDNIVTDFVADPAENQGALDYSAKLEEIKITVPTRDLKVNIAFNNGVTAQSEAYTDMTVKVSGHGLTEEAKLANIENNSATVEFKDVLEKDKAYTVEVSGAGYRTARYTVTMTANKELNFWNNVKDTAVNIEVDNDNSKKDVTFLAGELVKDGKINVYDLSAVVSYFGTDNLVTEHPDYARYDLNRDGKIDSKDVAFVLVSWGK